MLLDLIIELLEEPMRTRVLLSTIAAVALFFGTSYEAKSQSLQPIEFNGETYFWLLCRGPLTLSLQPEALLLSIGFLKSRNQAGNDGEPLAPGHCAFPDRALSGVEPETIVIAVDDLFNEVRDRVFRARTLLLNTCVRDTDCILSIPVLNVSAEGFDASTGHIRTNPYPSSLAPF